MRAWQPPTWLVTLIQGRELVNVSVSCWTRCKASSEALRRFPGWTVEQVVKQ